MSVFVMLVAFTFVVMLFWWLVGYYEKKTISGDEFYRSSEFKNTIKTLRVVAIVGTLLGAWWWIANILQAIGIWKP